MPVLTNRDPAELRRRLTAWLSPRITGGLPSGVSELTVPDASGFSSETVLFDAPLGAPGGGTGRYVARLRPDPSLVPVFPVYDLALQYRCMELVGARTSVPVPPLIGLELDEAVLGTPFLVMGRVEGVVPTDNPPYVFGGWLADAQGASLERLERESIGVLANVHTLHRRNADLSFLPGAADGESPLRSHFLRERAYYDWARDGRRSNAIEDAFRALEDRWPAETAPVLAWGDARIGNIIYRDFRPVAVLDWEMAAIAPRELDLAWMVFMHEFFQSMADRAGARGLSGLLDPERAAALYAAMTGHPPRDLAWFRAYAALRLATISLRTTVASAMRGLGDIPPDLDAAILHRPLLERLIAEL